MVVCVVYLVDIGVVMVVEELEIGLFVGCMYVFVEYGDVEVLYVVLCDVCELCFNIYVKMEGCGIDDWIVVGMQYWLVLSYLMLLEMVVLGFGWVELLCWMVEYFVCDCLCELCLCGWLCCVWVDVVWLCNWLLGLVGLWLFDVMLVVQ